MKNTSDLPFLDYGGNTGMSLASLDWSSHTLGLPKNWATELKVSVSLILQSLNPMAVVWGTEKILIFNEAFSDLFSLKAQAKPFDSYFPENQITVDAADLGSILLNQKVGNAFNFSVSRIDLSGERNGGIMLTQNFNVAQKSATKCTPQESDLTLFKFMADHAADPFILMREDASFAYLNQVAIDKWGYDEAEIKKLRVPDVDPLHGIENFNLVFFKAQNEKIETFETLHKNKAGHVYPVEVSMAGINLDGKPHLFAVSRDISERKSNEENLRKTFIQLEQSEKRFKEIVKQAPLGIAIFRGENYLTELVNDSYLEITDKKENDIIGVPLFESLPELISTIKPLFDQVYVSGTPFYGNEFPVTLKKQGKNVLNYFNFVYHPLINENHDVTGIMVVAIEVTKAVKAKHKLEVSEKEFRNFIMQSPIAMTILRGDNFVIEIANKSMLSKIWQKEQKEVLGKEIVSVFPELNEQKYPQLLKKVMQTRVPHKEEEAEVFFTDGDKKRSMFLDFEYAPLFDTEKNATGIMVTATDVTDKVESRLKVEIAEERMRLATDAAELATWEVDLKTTDIIYTPRMAEMFGHKLTDSLPYQTFIDQILPEDRQNAIKTAFERALETGIYKYEARVLKPDGQICWIRTQGKLFFDNENVPKKMIGTIRDITEEKQLQQTLRESEAKFRLLADSMPQHIWTSDPEGNLNYFNKYVYDFTGMTYEDIDREGWISIVHPEDREENVRLWLESISTGKDFHFEHRFRGNDGNYKWQLSRAIPQKDADGNIQMWVGSSTDIQDHKIFAEELEKQVSERTSELKEKNMDLEKINKELQSFAYISSHDLQEPLRKIQLFSSRLTDKESENLSPPGKQQLGQIEKAAKRMQTLIQDLLSYSRASSSKGELKPEHLEDQLNEVLENLAEAITQKEATIEIEELGTANIIAFQFRQLFQNLISNSLKFASSQRKPEIHIRKLIGTGDELQFNALDPEVEYWGIEYKDNGIGFEMEYKEKIFEIFQQLHDKSSYKGTGIGLAIVKKIVENHKGFITAESEVDKGVTFKMYFPV